MPIILVPLGLPYEETRSLRPFYCDRESELAGMTQNLCEPEPVSTKTASSFTVSTHRNARPSFHVLHPCLYIIVPYSSKTRPGSLGKSTTLEAPSRLPHRCFLRHSKQFQKHIDFGLGFLFPKRFQFISKTLPIITQTYIPFLSIRGRLLVPPVSVRGPQQ